MGLGSRIGVLLFPALSAAAWIACATGGTQELPREMTLTSRSDRLARCEMLGLDRVSPPYENASGWKGAIEKSARSIGGNAVYVQPPTGPSDAVTGRVYRCPDSTDQSPTAGRGAEAPEIPPDFPSRSGMSLRRG